MGGKKRYKKKMADESVISNCTVLDASCTKFTALVTVTSNVTGSVTSGSPSLLILTIYTNSTASSPIPSGVEGAGAGGELGLQYRILSNPIQVLYSYGRVEVG